MSETEAAPRSKKAAARQKKKQLRKERKAKGNGRDGGIRTPGLRDLLFKDLRPSELPANFRQDLRQLYRFYLDEERRAQLEAMGRVRRTFKLVGWTLKSLLAKLTPGRRLALFASIIMCIMGRVRIPLGDATLSTNLRVWAYLFVFLVLMLEMKDKLLARDEITSLNDSSNTKLAETATRIPTMSTRGMDRAKTLATVPNTRPTAKLPNTRRSSNNVRSTQGRSNRWREVQRIQIPGRIPRRNATRKSRFDAIAGRTKRGRYLSARPAGYRA